MKQRGEFDQHGDVPSIYHAGIGWDGRKYAYFTHSLSRSYRCGDLDCKQCDSPRREKLIEEARR